MHSCLLWRCWIVRFQWTLVKRILVAFEGNGDNIPVFGCKHIVMRIYGVPLI